LDVLKNIGAFFLLFIVLISLLPCSDEVACNDEPVTTNIQISHNDNTEENCTSICICACCGQRIVVVEQVQFAIQIPIQFPKHTIKKYQFHLEQLARNIWQPPKVNA